MKSGLRFLMTLLVVALTAAACGGSSEPETVITDVADSVSDAASGDDAEPAAESEAEPVAESQGDQAVAATETDEGTVEETTEIQQPEAAEPANSVLVSTADGGQIDIGSLEGTDHVFWFWAPW